MPQLHLPRILQFLIWKERLPSEGSVAASLGISNPVKMERMITMQSLNRRFLMRFPASYIEGAITKQTLNRGFLVGIFNFIHIWKELLPSK